MISKKIHRLCNILKECFLYKKEILKKFNTYIHVCLVTIIAGNLEFLIKELFTPAIRLDVLICMRLVPIVISLVMIILGKKHLNFLKYCPLILTFICGSLIMIAANKFPSPIERPSCEGQILYYMIAGLALAPCLFDILGHILGLLCIGTFTYLFYLIQFNPLYLHPELAMRCAITGLFTYVLGFAFSYAIYRAYYRNFKNEQSLKTVLNIDPLCRTYNRFWIQNHEDINNCIFGIVDCDNFKKINDTFGHNIGDIVLVSNSQLIMETLKNNEYFARFGGDEFILILDRNRDIETFRNIINNKLEEFYKDKEYKSTVSIGFSYIDTPTRIEDALKIADKYLYNLKKQKKQKSTR